MNEQITTNFNTSELNPTNTIHKNEIPEQAQKKLIQLIKEVLQPIRDELKEPIKIISGYRNEEVNKAVGGVRNSQHTKGEAVDIIAKDIDKLLGLLLISKQYDQLIIYFNKKMKIRFIHLSYRANQNRNQVIYVKK